MDLQIKTTSFGGYDKKAVEAYIEQQNEAHEKEVEELKANIVKLSETVKNLHTMREVNMNESSSTIDSLKKANDELQLEIVQIREKLDVYKQREDESASRYESISRTLLEARENADAMTRQTEAQCREKQQATEAYCDDLTSRTTAECDAIRAAAEGECEELRKVAQEETDTLRSNTEYDCRTLNEKTTTECEALLTNTTAECEEMRANAIAECEEMRNQARLDSYNTRMAIKRECESVSDFMSQLMVSVDNVVKACDETKKVADQAFPDLSNS